MASDQVSKTDPAAADADDLRDRVRETFFVGLGMADGRGLEGPLPEAISLANVWLAFASNVRGMVAMTTVPVNLANASAIDRHWQVFSATAAIRGVSIERRPKETRKDFEKREHAK